MRTPLSSIIFFVKQIILAFQVHTITEQEKTQSLKYCKLMLSQLYFLQSFVEDLLDLRQIKDGAFSLSSTPFDPNETFDLICSSFEPQVQLKGLQLVYNTFDGYELPKLVGDGKRFQQVVINLVRNAMKFTLNGSIQIKARYCVQQQQIKVSVKDTGSGIAEQDFPKLFTRFGKLKRTAKSNSAGIGLGLMIVKQIVESGGGQIKVKSDGLGKGSKFSFTMQMDQLVDA